MSAKVRHAVIDAAQLEEAFGPTQRQWYSWVEHKALPEDCYFRSGRALWFIRANVERWLGLNHNSTQHEES
jgi:hypothetical protein